MKQLLFLAIVLHHSLLLAQTSPKQETELNTHSSDRFTISYPSDWELKTDGSTAVQLYLLSPLTSD